MTARVVLGWGWASRSGKSLRGEADSSGAARKVMRPAPPCLSSGSNFCVWRSAVSNSIQSSLLNERTVPGSHDHLKVISPETRRARGRLLCKIRDVTATKRQNACWRLRMHPSLVTEIFISRWRRHGSRLLTGTRKGAIRTRPAGS
jgi:hypothetical protein